MKRPFINALTFAAEINACPARGLAPSLIYFFAASVEQSLSGCVADTSTMAYLMTSSATGMAFAVFLISNSSSPLQATSATSAMVFCVMSTICISSSILGLLTIILNINLSICASGRG